MSDNLPQTESREPDPLLPDSIGLSVDDVRALLARKHETSVPKDDPILMVVTILNAFLGRQDELQKKHEKALAAFMGEQTAAYVKGVEESVASLSKTLSGATVEGIGKAVGDMAANLAGHRSTMYLCTAVMAVSALLNVTVFILEAVRHG